MEENKQATDKEMNKKKTIWESNVIIDTVLLLAGGGFFYLGISSHTDGEAMRNAAISAIAMGVRKYRIAVRDPDWIARHFGDDPQNQS